MDNLRTTVASVIKTIIRMITFMKQDYVKSHQRAYCTRYYRVFDMYNNNENNKKINPDFRTNPEDYSKVEIAKINSSELRGSLFSDFRDYGSQNIPWESEQITKSHGIYLEFNRAKTGNEKDWMYMLRITIPGGGPLTAKQWNILDRVSDRYTIGPENAYPHARPGLKITTRQNIQLHWVRKEHVVDAIKDISESGFFTMNGCGDNTRNVLGCPLSYHSTIFNANSWAQRVGKYFALPTAAYMEIFEIDPKYLRNANLEERTPGVSRFDYGPNQLNRKFKIAFSAIHYDEVNKHLSSSAYESSCWTYQMKKGTPLVDPDTGEQYLHFVPRKDVAIITDFLFEYYIRNRSEEEDKPGGMGYYLRRVGPKEIISYLKSNPRTADLMKKTFKL